MNESMTRQYFSKHFCSPVGRLELVAGERGLAAILWEDDNPRRVRLDAVDAVDSHPVLLQAERELREYFAGE